MFRRLFAPSTPSASKPRTRLARQNAGLHTRRLFLEPLEQRQLLSVTMYVDYTDIGGSGPAQGQFTVTGQPAVTGLTLGTDLFTSIGAAVSAAAAGDTIHVADGTFHEMVSLGKSLTLRGANAGIHPAVGMHPTETVGVRGPETILPGSGHVFVPAADDITIDGFMFTGDGGRIIDTYADANSFHLTNNIFENDARAVTQGVIQFGGGSHTGMKIDFNLFQDRGDHTIYTGGGPFDGLTIEYNKFNGYGNAVFWTASPLVDGVIRGNEFDGTIGGVPGEGGAPLNIGQGGNIQIVDNWFHDVFYTAFQVGIDGGLVAGNTIERVHPYSGYWGSAFELWGGQWGTLESTNVTVTDNIIHFNDVPGASDPTHGLCLRAPDGGSGIDAATIHVNNNQFLDGGVRGDAKAVWHQGNQSTTLDAVGNWWGTNDGDVIAAKAGDNVEYDPWIGKSSDPSVVEIPPDIEPWMFNQIVSDVAASSEMDMVSTTVDNTELAGFLAMVEGLPAQSSPVTVVVYLADGTYDGLNLDVPANVTLVIDGQNGTATIQGSSPALTVLAGQVVAQNGLTFSVATNDPTIVVHGGGSLTLTDSTVHESNTANQTAILVHSGGMLDLSSADNTINVRGAGQLITWQDTASLDIIGNTLQIDSATLDPAVLADNFTIEDHLTHALDNAAYGLVTWKAGNVYVTQASGSVQRGVDVAGISDTINVAAGTYGHDGQMNIDRSVTVVGAGQDATIIQRSGEATGKELRTVQINASDVTFQSLTFGGWAETPSNANVGNGYLVWMGADDTTFDDVRFDGDDIRVAIYVGTRNDLTVTDSRFTGTYFRAAIRGAGERMLISHNSFEQSHYWYSPIYMEYGAPTSGEISYNYFASRVGVNSQVHGNFKSDGTGLWAITNWQPNKTTADGLYIVHNTFHFQDSDLVNGLGNQPIPEAIHIDPLVPASGPIVIRDNVFQGYEYTGPQAPAPLTEPVWHPDGGVFDGALELQGDGQYGWWQDPDFDFDLGEEGTFAIWVNLNESGRRQQIARGPLTAQINHNNAVYFYTNRGQSSRTLVHTTDNAIQQGAWTHIAFTWDLSTKTGRIFIDGVEASYVNGPNVPSWNTPFEMADALQYFGRDPGDAGRDLNAKLDDMAWYNRALTQSEIQQIADQAESGVLEVQTNLVAHWDFDQSSGGVAVDSINGVEMNFILDGKSVHEFLYATPTAEWRDGEGVDFGSGPGGALEFDGLTNYATFSDPDLEIGSNGSVSVWVKLDQLGKRHAISHGALEFQIDNSNRVYFYANKADGSNQTLVQTNALPFQAGQWAHLAITWDLSSQTGRIYFNGTEAPTGYRSGYAPLRTGWVNPNPTAGQTFYVGTDPTTGGRHFDGLMDDLAYFGKTLSPAEIQDIMNDGAATGSDQAAHWTFDAAPVDDVFSGNSGTEIDLVLFREQPPPPIQGIAINATATTVVSNNVFHQNDVDFNTPIDDQGDNLFGNPVFNLGIDPDEHPYQLGFGSIAAYASSEYQLDENTPVPHVGAYQGDPGNFATGDMIVIGSSGDDILELVITGENSGTLIFIRDQGGANEVTFTNVALSAVTGLTFYGFGGDDQLIINNPTGSVFAPVNGIYFHGGDGDDAMQILGGEVDTVEHVFTNASDGFVYYDGVLAITYTGLAPIDDTIDAAHRIFTFTGAGETITLSDDTGTPGNSHIVSTLGESVSFANPTASMTIKTTATAGADSINIQGVDDAFTAALTITAKPEDSVTFQTNPTGIGTGALSVTAGSIAVDADVTTSDNASLTATTSTISGTGTLAANGLTANAVSGIDLNTTVATITAGVSAAGAISITESSAVTLTDVSTGNGPITVSAGGAIVATSVVSLTDNDDNDISITASTGNITIGVINAGTDAGGVTVTATEGSILDATTDPNTVTDITANVLTLTAATGIGAANNSLDIRANSLSASMTGAGLINVSEFDGIILDEVSTADGPITISADGTVNAVSVVSTTDDDENDITISTTAGDIVVTTITAGDGEKADVTLTAQNGAIYDATSETVTADVLTLSAKSRIDLTTDVNSITAETTDAGDILIRENDAVTLTSVTAADGSVHIDAGGSIALGAVSAAGNTVLLQTPGAITDANGAANNVTAARLAMTAGTGIGAGDALETAVGTLAASSTAGDIEVANTSGGLTIGSITAFSATVTGVTASAGTIDITTSTHLTVDQPVAATGGDVTLTGGTGGGAAITLNQPVTATGPVTVFGGPGADTITVNVAGSSNIKLDGQGGDDHYIIQLGGLAAGAIHIDDSGASTGDRAKLLGTSADDDITLLTDGIDPSWAGEVTLAGATPGVVRFSDSIEFVTLYGDAGADTFEVQPSATAEITVNGGSPSFGLGPGEVPGDDPDHPNPGDTLIFDPLGNLFSIVVNEIHTTGGFQIVRFLDIENVPIEPIGTADTYRLDLNSSAGSETQDGYEAVLPGHLYAPANNNGGTGYGWVGTGAGGFDRGEVSSFYSSLIRDGHWGTDPREFRVDVPDTNWYLVSVKMGEVVGARDLMRVRNVDTGQILVDNVTTPAGQVEELNFVVQATADGGGGRIQLEFSTQGGDPYWMVNAIEVRPAEILNMGIAPDARIADGATETAYTGVLASPDALVTVATTLGTILTPDAEPHIVGIQVQADADGNFPFTIRHPSGGGQAVLTFDEVTGARTGIATIEYSLPATRRFDFNRSGSPTQAPVNGFPQVPGVQEPGGYIGVLPGDTYSSALGYGWLTEAGAVNRGTLSGTDYSDLLQDSHWGTAARTFQIDLPAGTYEVTVTMGDTSARDQMAVTVVKGTGAGLPGINTAAGQYVHRTFTVSPVGGEVQLEFSTGGSDPYWMLNALEVRPVVASSTLDVTLGGTGSDEADGTTIDTFSQTGLPDGLYTVTATAGTILNADADGRYTGTQVLVSGGALNVQLQRPSGAGEVIVSAKHVAGLANASGSQTYTGSVGYRFDMNRRASSPTQSDYTAVLPGTGYSSALGYGWLVSPGGLDRGTLSGTTNSALLQDSHWGTAARTFQIDLPAGTYEVTVTMGDTSARDQMAVDVVKGTGAGLTGINTAAGQYVHRTFTVSPVGGEVQLEFSTTGGDSYWMLNALEVRSVVTSSTLDVTLGGTGSDEADGTTVDTFSQTGLPDGLYTVTATAGTILNADADGRYAGTQVLVSGGSLTIDLQRPSGGVDVTVTAEHVAGLGNAIASQTYTASVTHRFDMNRRANSPTQSGYTAVLPGTLYSSALGYGWLVSPGGLDRGTRSGTTNSALLQDSHWGTAARTFQIDLPDGDYEVTVTMGDTSARDHMAVTVVKGTGAGLTGINTAAGQYVHRTFTVSPVGGEVQLEFSTTGGDRYWMLNALEVRSVVTPGQFTTAPTSEQPADGTLDTFSVTGLTDGDIYTVTTTLGSVVAPDADARYMGTQVIVSGGKITFQVRRPSAPGQAVVLAEQVNGATRFEATVDYVAPLTVQGGVRLGSSEEESLTLARLAPVVSEAIARWTAVGLAGEHVALLESVPWTITDLDAQGYLGLAGPHGIQIDDDAAGHGWYIDAMAGDDGAFAWDGGQWVAFAGSPAAGRVDLLTVVMHELGHTLGLPDLDAAEHPYDLMSEVLGTGTRRLPNGSHAAVVQGETALAAALAQPLRAAATPSMADRFEREAAFTSLLLAEEPRSLAAVPSAPLDRVFSDLGDLRRHDLGAALHRVRAVAGAARLETSDESLSALAAGLRASQSHRLPRANGELNVRDELFATLDGSLENLFGDERFEER